VLTSETASRLAQNSSFKSYSFIIGLSASSDLPKCCAIDEWLVCGDGIAAFEIVIKGKFKPFRRLCKVHFLRIAAV